MLRPDPRATPSSIDSTSVGLWYSIDQLRGDDADDAAMPALAGDDEHVVRADLRIALDGSAGPRRGSPPPVPAAWRSLPTTAARAARARARILVARPRKSNSSTASSGVLMRPAALSRGARHEAHMKAVQPTARQTRLLQQRLETSPVRAGRQTRRPQLAMTRFSPTSGTTSASVPMAATFTKWPRRSGPRPSPRAGPARA